MNPTPSPFLSNPRPSAVGASLGRARIRLQDSALCLFMKELISNPRAVGAACPSSRKLASQMAAFVPAGFDGRIVELGAGTGVITSALLQRGVAPGSLVLVERSPELSRLLRNRFPLLTVLHGDAGRLDELLMDHVGSAFRGIDLVVSSLPLKSMAVPVVTAIGRQLERVLVDGGRFIRFTYDLRPDQAGPFQGLTRRASRTVWTNLPPARVDLFEFRRPAAGRYITAPPSTVSTCPVM